MLRIKEFFEKKIKFSKMLMNEYRLGSTSYFCIFSSSRTEFSKKKNTSFNLHKSSGLLFIRVICEEIFPKCKKNSCMNSTFKFLLIDMEINAWFLFVTLQNAMFCAWDPNIFFKPKVHPKATLGGYSSFYLFFCVRWLSERVEKIIGWNNNKAKVQRNAT